MPLTGQQFSISIVHGQQRKQSNMQTRTITSISALMLSVAFAATPVLAADSVPGNKVSAPTVNRDAPARIPAGATPLPVPQVAPSSLRRGPRGLDPTSAADSMGSLT